MHSTSLRTLVISLLMPLGACEPKPPEIHYEEACSASAEHVAFVVECTRAGNPMSDEEGEDLVAQCAATSERLFTKTCTVVASCRQFDNAWRVLPMSRCEPGASPRVP